MSRCNSQALSFLQISIEASKILKLLDQHKHPSLIYQHHAYYSIFQISCLYKANSSSLHSKEFHIQSRPYIESISLSLSASLSKPSKLTELPILQPQFPNCIGQGINNVMILLFIFVRGGVQICPEVTSHLKYFYFACSC